MIQLVATQIGQTKGDTMNENEKIIVDKIGDTIISITKLRWENGDLIVEIIEN